MVLSDLLAVLKQPETRDRDRDERLLERALLLHPDNPSSERHDLRRVVIFEVKVALAVIVLVCFITAMMLQFLDKMNPAIFRAIHLLVFTCITGIVVLAKAMFYA